MSHVEQEADNSKSNSEESDVVLKNRQMVRVQQMATVEGIQQKHKDKDSAVSSKLQRYESSRKHFSTNDWTTSCKPFNAINAQDGKNQWLK
ncbi:D-2-hydroxyglutarate dehydrogenase, mitochondrial [Dorcoceras hygrometricum]|uniref:D-2-hydroxyglutarate dehydrogenase, mitochondrial n=1 Tax=Dorcoceras hygrometricum TaxID=472368 RepID=A0A2Z7ASZ3_9LAMI|nr:D-2-hydroxyglutarate dehydrogenase, mitochondrial [Dorcoceras hygrometricum]